MKTTIDSKQAERLKEVCEKHSVKLPEFYVHRGGNSLGELCYDEVGKYEDLSFIELLDWLPEKVPHRMYPKDVKINSNYINLDWSCSRELIDSLLELFIWTIENGYYKGV